jgi:hypothetical protein
MTLLAKSPELQALIVETPLEFQKQLPSSPDLARLFTGIDIHALAEKLLETLTPRAANMEDAALLAYLAKKEKLLSLLLTDLDTLSEAIASQPKLQQFFSGTTPEQIRNRVKALGGQSNV